MRRNWIYGFILLVCSIETFAVQTDDNKTIAKLSIETGDRGYITTFTLVCQYSVVYFDLASASGKGYLSVLLAAKMSGKKISVTYDKDINNICTLSHAGII